MKWKILVVALLIIGALFGYKFYNDTVEEQNAQTYETEKKTV